MEISQGIQILHSQFCRSCGYGEKRVILKVFHILTHISKTTRPTCSKVQYLYSLQPVQQNPCVICCAAIVNFIPNLCSYLDSMMDSLLKNVYFVYFA